MLWIIVLIVFQAIQFITLKRFSELKGIWSSLFIRNTSLAFMSVGILWYKDSRYTVMDMGLFIAGGVLDVLGNAFIGLAAQFIWIEDVTCISLNLPIPSSLLAWIILRENIDVFSVACLVVNGVGLVFVSNPSFLFPNSAPVSSSFEIGVITSFMSLICSSVLTLICRYLVTRETEDAFLLTTLSGLSGIALSSCIASITTSWGLPETYYEWIIAILLGISTVLTVYPQFKVLETETTMTATVFGTLTTPLTCLYDIFVLHRRMEWQAVSGVVFIIGSTFTLHFKRELLEKLYMKDRDSVDKT